MVFDPEAMQHMPFVRPPVTSEPTLEDLEKEGLVGKNGETPEWIRAMQEAADAGDAEYQKVLAGTNNDPVKIMQNINKTMDKKREEIYSPEKQIDPEQAKNMRVRFREIQHYNCWIWVRLANTPSTKEKELVKEVFKSWFVLGRLSAFNAMNLQVFHNGAGDTSFLDYEHDDLESGMTSCFHEMSEPEFKGKWGRIWIDLGTADEFSLDILINAFAGFSREHSVVTDLVVGGENEDWPVPELTFEDANLSNGIPQGVDMSKFGIGGDPDEKTGYELDEMDEIGDIDAYLKNDDDVW